METKNYKGILESCGIFSRLSSFALKKSPLTIVGIFLCGLIASQCVATLHVWFSNQNLHAKLQAITGAGYFTIPNPLVFPPIDSFDAAFWGGLFFTLTIGTGVTLVAFAATFFWVVTIRKKKNRSVPPSNAKCANGDHFPKTRKLRIKIDLLLLLVIWAYFLFNLNKTGICIIESLYFLAIPLVVVPLTYRWTNRLNPRNLLRQIFISLSPIVLLTLIWGTQWDENLFIRIRDHLLLESTGGRAINDFYYRYTLYPAEAFKSLSQKMLKTCYLGKLKDPKLTLQINGNCDIRITWPLTTGIQRMSASMCKDQSSFFTLNPPIH